MEAEECVHFFKKCASKWRWIRWCTV